MHYGPRMLVDRLCIAFPSREELEETFSPNLAFTQGKTEPDFFGNAYKNCHVTHDTHDSTQHL